ncbi:MAG TPA: RsmE family RNA methyltransferase [Ktedonobacterales bacterium]|nr:RsmE family RNA methyltransferase [Ktedonobacterales bacterium]
MPAGRFVLLDVALAEHSELDLPPDVAHQVRDVLRATPGDTIHLLDGHGATYPADVLVLERRRVVVRLGFRQEQRQHDDHACRVVLCPAMLKAAKFEWVLQKATELGVGAIQPLLTERAVAAAEITGAARQRRWQRILAEAVEQCGGDQLPTLNTPRPLMHTLSALPADAIALFSWEEADAVPLRATLAEAIATAGGLASIAEVYIFIGPEGGFSAGEAALASRHGALHVSLGSRILRAETAALVATTLTLDTIGALDTAPLH